MTGTEPGAAQEPPAPYEGDRYQRLTLTGDPSSRSHALLHRLLESGETDRHYARVLEVGANRGEHLAFVRHPWSEYVMLDLVDRIEGALPPGARFVNGDAQALPFSDAHFDRTVMTCVLHHLTDPEQAMAELRRVTRPSGRISVLLPTDPGIAYRAVRALTSGQRARRSGVTRQQRLSHAREHRNHFASLLIMLRSVFAADDVDVRYFPLPVPTWNLNLLTVVSIRRANGDDGPAGDLHNPRVSSG